MSHPCGVDAQGRIAQPPERPIPAPFDALLQTAGNTLQQALGPHLHSLYVYGSVARGTARAGHADLDLCLLLQAAATPAQQAQIETLRKDLQARHAGIVTKIDIDLGDAASALAPAQRLSWGYWLKHHCRCIAGPDLRARIAPFLPSREIALAVNQGYDTALRSLAARIRLADAGAAALQKQAARQWIRATHVLCAGDAPGWPQTLQDYASCCRRSYPALAADLRFMLAQADTPDAPAAAFAQTLLRLLDTMQTLLAQQPRNAGAHSS